MPPRTATNGSIDDILRAAMEPVLKRASTAIARALAEAAAEHIDGELQRGLARARGSRGRVPAAARSTRPARRRAEITRWAADRRARRVPTFVIDMTNGLDTKKKIVAKFGEDAVFEKGKPLPKPK
jgi:hypothetical protein